MWAICQPQMGTLVVRTFLAALAPIHDLTSRAPQQNLCVLDRNLGVAEPCLSQCTLALLLSGSVYGTFRQPLPEQGHGLAGAAYCRSAAA